MIDLQAIHTAINAAHRYRREAPGRDDWQTPAEFDASGEGDCEDFAIAYWHALRDVPGDARLAICLRGVESHMVCLYYPPGADPDEADPVVFDVAVDAVCPLSLRPDLVVICTVDAHNIYAGRDARRISPTIGLGRLLNRIEDG